VDVVTFDVDGRTARTARAAFGGVLNRVPAAPPEPGDER
jgi:hypothetical protein